MWSFCLRSLVREYGWQFAARVALRHPLRTLRALREAAALDVTGEKVDVGPESSTIHAAARPSIVGAGFCLKPLDPPCPSGRANHDCHWLQQPAGWNGSEVPTACRACAIRAIGTDALRAGSAFYVMTSARDILEDVFVPTMARGTSSAGAFVLCRYSFKPFALGLLASGMSGRLLPLARGDCRDYPSWLRADRGIKSEQTIVADTAWAQISITLSPPGTTDVLKVERRGNVLFPVTAGTAARAVD